MSVRTGRDFAGAAEAKAEIAAAARYLLKGATGTARDTMVREIIEMVGDVASARHDNPLDAHAARQSTTYKDYVIDAYLRDTDRWRATIRRSNGKKIRVTFPLSVRSETTTSADALTAEKAVELAKTAIDEGELV